MLIEQQQRDHRVRFKHPIRVVTLEGQPRVIRTLTSNVSRRGLFLRMPEPLPHGTRVALSLEAGGRALAFAEAQVVWSRLQESHWPGRFPGCGVRFTEYLHPRAPELVRYLVENLDRGRPLSLAPAPARRWKWLALGGTGALGACAAAAFLILSPSEPDPVVDEAPAALTLIGPPVVRVESPSLVAPEPVAATPTPIDASPIEPAPAATEELPVDPVKAAELPPDVAAPEAIEAIEAVEAPAPAVVEKVATVSKTLRLPSGAAKSITLSEAPGALEVSVSAEVSRVFLLVRPPRLVFDLEGPHPVSSHVLSASLNRAKRVRVGRLPSGTRVVVDLEAKPKSLEQQGSTATLRY